MKPLTSTKADKGQNNAAENFEIITRLALNIIKTDISTKASEKRKRKITGWYNQHLEHLLSI